MSPINSNENQNSIAQLAKRFEQPGMQLLLAESFSAPVDIYKITCEVMETKPLQLLEEFVLRAAVEVRPPLHWRRLADVLKVDERFVGNTKQQLQQLKAVAEGDLLEATETGQRYYATGVISAISRQQSWYLVSIPILGRIIAIQSVEEISEASEGRVIEFDYSIDVNSLQLDEIINITTQSGLRYHNDNQQIVKCNEIKQVRKGFLSWAVCAYHDWLKDEDPVEWFTVRSPRIRSEESNDQRVLSYIQNIVTLDELYANRTRRLESLSIPSSWESVFNQAFEDFRSTVSTTRNHEQTDARAEIIDTANLFAVVQEAGQHAKESLFFVYDLPFHENQEAFFRWIKELAERHILVGIAVPSHISLDQLTLEELRSVEIAEGFPAITVFTVEKRIPFIIVVDREEVILPIMSSIKVEADEYFVSFSRTTSESTISTILNQLPPSLAQDALFTLAWTKLSSIALLGTESEDQQAELIQDLLKEVDITKLLDLLAEMSLSDLTIEIIHQLLLRLSSASDENDERSISIDKTTRKSLKRVLKKLQSQDRDQYDSIKGAHSAFLLAIGIEK